MKDLTYGSVCSGIEAVSVAWDGLNLKPIWFSEIEPFPCAVLAHHYPSVPNYGDMTTLPERILSGEIEAPDILVGGTPCQAFSVAGTLKRKGGALSGGSETLIVNIGATLTTGFGGRGVDSDQICDGNCVINYPKVRKLTPVECERLQGFPDNYTQIPWKNKPAEQCPDTPRYMAIGNSMAVPVMRWIGERMCRI